MNAELVLPSLLSNIIVNDAFVDEMRRCGFVNESSCYFQIFAVLFNLSQINSNEVKKQVYNAYPRKKANVKILELADMFLCFASGRDAESLLNNSLESQINKYYLQTGTILCVYSEMSPFDDLKEIKNHIAFLLDSIAPIRRKTETIKPGCFFVESFSGQSTMATADDINSIIRLFEKGNFPEMESNIDQIVETIRKNNRLSTVPPTSIKRFFVETVTFIAHKAYDYGVDVDRLMNYEDPYQIIFSMNETPDIKAWFLDVCKSLYTECQINISQNKDALIAAVENCAADNFKKSDFGVADIAMSMNLSPSYLSSCYSAVKGNTIIKYINQLRLECACDLLTNSKRKINDICQASGYSSLNYFYTVFKKELGMTPAEYRKNKQ